MRTLSTAALLFLALTTASGARAGELRAPRVLSQVRLAPPKALELFPLQRSQPVAHGRDGMSFVAGRSGRVWGLNADGTVRWVRPVGAPVDAGLTLEGEGLFVATSDGLILALDPLSGDERWRYRLSHPVERSPVFSEGVLVVPSSGDSVTALDAKSGRFLWFYRRPRGAGMTVSGSAGVAVSAGRVVAAFSDGAVVTLAFDDGRVVWERVFPSKTSFVDIDATPVVVGEGVFVASFEGAVYSLSLLDGAVRWSVETGQRITQAVKAGKHLVVAGPGAALALRPSDGKRLWRAPLAEGNPAEPIVHRGQLLVGTDQGPLYGLSLRTGRHLTAFGPGNGVSAAPQVGPDNALWVWTNGGVLYKLSWP